MSVLLFSGGIDSTVLAYDLVTCPERYGVPRSGHHLTLLTMAGARGKRRALSRLVTLLQLHARIHEVPVTVEHRIVRTERHLLVEAPVTAPKEGSLLTFGAKAGPFTTARMSAMSPYTPSLHLFAAGVAANIAGAVQEPHWTPEQVFWGFQMDGAAWEAWDAGTLPRNDTSPAFVAALNEASKHSGHARPALFRAPYLENRMDRAMVIRLGMSLGVPFEETSSCTLGWMRACGACARCVARTQAFAGIEVQDALGQGS